MAKRKQDLKPDTVLKNYWNDKEQFADLFNAILFDGEQVIKTEELEDADTEESNVLEHRDYAESIKASRDNEYLSRMKKTDTRLPVITIVVYYGEKAWDGATSLYGMLNISEKMKSLVNDYKMRLVEARKNNLTLHNMNNKDLFYLLEVMLDKSISRNVAKAKVIQYSREHKVDKSVIMAVAGAANVKLDYNALAEKGDSDMCILFEEIAKENEVKGRAIEIVETGYGFRLSENEILERLQKKLNISLQVAQEYLKMFGEQTV